MNQDKIKEAFESFSQKDSLGLRKKFDGIVRDRFEINKNCKKHITESDAMKASEIEAWGEVCWFTGIEWIMSQASEEFDEWVRQVPTEVILESKAHRELKDPKSMPMIIWQAAKLSSMKEIAEKDARIKELEYEN